MTAGANRRTTVRRPLDAAAERQRRRSTRIGATIVALAMVAVCACGGAVGATVEHLWPTLGGTP